MPDRPADVTQLLRAASIDRQRLAQVVYAELRDLADARMRAERRDHTLQATALVHEAYLRLVGQAPVEWRDRRQFYAAAAEAMRRVLVDHARRVHSQKRGGDWQAVTLGGDQIAATLDVARTLELDAAFERLASEDPDAAEVTRLRFYAGLSVEATAAALGMSVRSVHRKWTYARARLFELLEDAT